MHVIDIIICIMQENVNSYQLFHAIYYILSGSPFYCLFISMSPVVINFEHLEGAWGDLKSIGLWMLCWSVLYSSIKQWDLLPANYIILAQYNMLITELKCNQRVQGENEQSISSEKLTIFRRYKAYFKGVNHASKEWPNSQEVSLLS